MPSAPRSPLALLMVLASGLPAFAGETAHETSHELAARLRAESESREALELLRRGPQPMTATFLLQTRYMSNVREDNLVGENDQFTTGFTIPRAELRLDSNIFNEQVSAHVSLDFGDAETKRGRGEVPAVDGSSGTPVLLHAYAQYNFTGKREGYYVRVGQFRSNVIYEDSVAPEYGLAVERSLTNEFFALGDSQGVAVGRVNDKAAWEVTFTDGGRTLGVPAPTNTAYDSDLEWDWAFSWRVDRKLSGDWTRFADFTSWRGAEPAWRFGGGIQLQRRGSTNPEGNVPDYLFGTTHSMSAYTWTVDTQYEGDGWSLYAAYVGNRIKYEYPEPPPAGGTLELYHHGWVVQASMFMTDQVEAIARYDGLRFSDDLVNGFGTAQQLYQFITVGLNYYMVPESHSAKFSLDVVYTPSRWDTLGAGADNSIFLPDPTVTGLLGITDREWVLRAQLQFLF